jgi:hypothetical protein
MKEKRVSVREVQRSLKFWDGFCPQEIYDLLDKHHPGWRKTTYIIVGWNCRNYRAVSLNTARLYGYID